MKINANGTEISILGNIVNERLVLAWDPDFTKLTPKEREQLEAAESGEYVDSEDIDWND